MYQPHPQPFPIPICTGINNEQDALAYLNAVKSHYAKSNNLQEYETLMSVLQDWKSRRISTADVIAHVTTAFRGNEELILGFLSPAYRIERDLRSPNGVKIITPRV